MVPDKIQDVNQAVHNLGMAAWFGGVLFGKFALNPAVRAIPSHGDRGKVVNQAWLGYNAINIASLAAIAVGHGAGRLTELRDENLSERERPLVKAMDVFTAASVASGVASAVQGARLANQAPGGAVPVETGTRPSTETPPRAARLQRSLEVLGNVNVLSGVGLVTSTGLFWRSAVSRPPRRRALRRRAKR